MGGPAKRFATPAPAIAREILFVMALGPYLQPAKRAFREIGTAIVWINKKPRQKRGFLNKRKMPRDRIELSTPGFSDQCSTTELPRHYLNIIQNLGHFGNIFCVLRRRNIFYFIRNDNFLAKFPLLFQKTPGPLG